MAEEKKVQEEVKAVPLTEKSEDHGIPKAIFLVRKHGHEAA